MILPHRPPARLIKVRRCDLDELTVRNPSDLMLVYAALFTMPCFYVQIREHSYVAKHLSSLMFSERNQDGNDDQ